MKQEKQNQSFEQYITKVSFYIALVPTVLLIIFLYQADISIYLKVIITIFFSTVLGIGHLFIWRRVRNQFRTTTNIVEGLITGETTMRPSSAVKSGALAELNLVINQAAEQLAEQRLVSKEHHIAMAKVLEHINVAVICLDDHNVITLLNPKAKQLFSVHDEMIGIPAKVLGIDTTQLDQQMQQVVTLNVEKIQKRVYLQMDTYQLYGKTHTLLFLNDVQKLLQNEERVAWQRLLRVLSHEINNSLAPIASIGESLIQLIDNDSCTLEEEKEDITGGLNIITQRALALDSFIKEYQSLTRLPEPKKAVFSLTELVKQQLELFPELEATINNDSDIDIYGDATQLAQVLVNLLKNAQQAMEHLKQTPDQSKTNTKVSITYQTNVEQVQIQIQDSGMGISNPDNLFIPFYTTKSKGSGIGLVLSRQIMFNHGGDLSLTNVAQGSGAIATISLPIILSPNSRKIEK